MIITLPKAKQKALRKANRQNIYKLIQEYEKEDIRWLCRQLGIARSSYYKWKHRRVTALEEENSVLLEQIRAVAESNNSLFGVWQMTYAVNALREEQSLSKVNHKRVARLMCIHDIRSQRSRYNKPGYSHIAPEQTAQNIMNREFNTSGPYEKLCTDITEKKIPGTKDKIYISTILDLYGTYPLAVKVSRRNDVALVNDTFNEVAKEMPEGFTPLFHSDRGFQYTRKPFAAMLEEAGMTQSMSRVSRCIDNGPMESFQGMIKEMLDVLFPAITSYEEMEEAVYATYDYYIHNVPLKRYVGKTAAQVHEEGINAEVPQVYPIVKNPVYIKYWNNLNEKKQAAMSA